MAVNDVRLYGQIMEEPRFYLRRNETLPHKCVLSVKTLSRFNNSSDKSRIVYDEIILMTENPDMIQYARRNLQINDIVYIKGILCTADTTRKLICSECGSEFTELGYTCYVHPIHIVLIESQVSDDQGYVLLRQNAEVSNEVILDGRVCTEIAYYEERRVANYKLAVKRPFHILEDSADKKADFPVVNTYFDQAESDWKYACKGTRMNVKGSIRVRAVERKVCCPECGCMEDVTYRILEVVASGVGYTSDWNQPERVEKKPEIIVRDGLEEDE